MDGLSFGFVLVLVGLFFFLGARLLVRAVPGLRPAENIDLLTAQSAPDELEDAVLVIQAGGKVRSLNARARQVFHLNAGDIPTSSRWPARRVRRTHS